MDPPSVSFVCVSNNPHVFDHCLGASLRGISARHELIVVDNTDQRFSTAASALNAGVREATGKVVAFVQQDVFIHDVVRFEVAGACILAGHTGMVGAVGVHADGWIMGRMRDRVFLSGADRPEPVGVDSVDEVAFVIERERLLDEPLNEAPELSWHAYAVEYSMRLANQRFRTTAMNLAITHNSRSTNIAGLTEAHKWLIHRYPEALPMRTTCGPLGGVSDPGGKQSALGRSREWAGRLRTRVKGKEPRVSFDCEDVDLRLQLEDLRWGPEQDLTIINFDPTNCMGTSGKDAVRLPRGNRWIRVMTATTPEQVHGAIEQEAARGPVLLADLPSRLVQEVASRAIAFVGKDVGGYFAVLGDLASLVPREFRHSNH